MLKQRYMNVKTTLYACGKAIAIFFNCRNGEKPTITPPPLTKWSFLKRNFNRVSE